MQLINAKIQCFDCGSQEIRPHQKYTIQDGISPSTVLLPKL